VAMEKNVQEASNAVHQYPVPSVGLPSVRFAFVCMQCQTVEQFCYVTLFGLLCLQPGPHFVGFAPPIIVAIVNCQH
jgi:hypothetical protein